MNETSGSFDHTKTLVLNHMAGSGWDLADADTDTEWWACEHWTITSTQQLPELALVLTFLVDPQYEGTDKGSAVWAVMASTCRPKDQLDTSMQVAEERLQSGKLEASVRNFMDQVDQYRNDQHETINRSQSWPGNSTAQR